MDWYPLINSVRIALISTVIVFFLGVWLANAVVRAPRVVKGVLDVVLTLPLVLPPTVVGYLLLLLLGPKRPLGMLVAQLLNLKLTMVWYAAIFATVVVSFPLMYRTTRGAFESFDQTLADAALTLGHSERWVFWRVKMPSCAQGIMAGGVLAFARALGEYGATAMICGYTPGYTATVSTTVYQLWRTGDDAGALTWVLVNLAISAVVLLAMNLLESRSGRARGRGARA
ncbi:molybdate ABC transporter permease subunit [Thermophilibacter immobilis]|uniref:Molybdenum transport system permease n=1 Tax=Thermophilibacter immobilis TaxID=2779519 RepID=A0A7S7M7L2_9ACTN|nr:molybdate ABC transporter permease subunit [Thermophilibacter immobilis]QOY60207.1 molybdate ABC transporter permease subunit [Thermophilibacter immobilis]